MKLSEYDKDEREKLYKQVLDLYNNGISRKEIAERTGLNLRQVSYVKDMFQNTGGKFFTNDNYQSLDSETVQMIIHMHATGMSAARIAKELGISKYKAEYWCYTSRKEAVVRWNKSHHHVGHTYKSHRKMLEGKV